MKAIRIEQTGGPSVMRLVDAEVGKPGEGQIRVRHTAIGLNYITGAQHRGQPGYQDSGLIKILKQKNA